MDLSRLFDLNYLFDPTPGAQFSLVWWVIGFWVLVFILGLSLYAISYNKKGDRVYRKLYKNWSSYLIYWSLIGIVITWLRDQNIPYIGMRAVLVLYILFFLLLTVRKLLFDKKHIPKIKHSHLTKSHKSKYLPGRKK